MLKVPVSNRDSRLIRTPNRAICGFDGKLVLTTLILSMSDRLQY